MADVPPNANTARLLLVTFDDVLVVGEFFLIPFEFWVTFEGFRFKELSVTEDQFRGVNSVLYYFHWSPHDQNAALIKRSFDVQRHGSSLRAPVPTMALLQEPSPFCRIEQVDDTCSPRHEDKLFGVLGRCNKTG
jgi:hypothetical protein